MEHDDNQNRLFTSAKLIQIAKQKELFQFGNGEIIFDIFIKFYHFSIEILILSRSLLNY